MDVVFVVAPKSLFLLQAAGVTADLSGSAGRFDLNTMKLNDPIVATAFGKLKDLVSGKADVTPLLRSPSSHLNEIATTIGASLPQYESLLRDLAGQLAHELESRPRRLLSLLRRSARWMGRGVVSELPEAGPWLEYFRAVEAQLPGSVVLAHARAMVRLAGMNDDRLPQVLSRILPPRRERDMSDEEHFRRELDWLGKVIEGVFGPVALDALAFVESLRKGKGYFRHQIRGAQFEQVLESLQGAPGGPVLDCDLFRIRNAIEHDTFSHSDGSFRLRGKRGKAGDWSREIAFDSVQAKGREVLFNTAAISFAMQVVMLESVAQIILQPAVSKVLIAALRGQDPSPFDAEAKTAFTEQVGATLCRLEKIA